MMTEKHRVCDYGDSTYRQDFWEGQGRDYEDVVERQVLAQLLPASGKRLLEIGAGFGRITNEYHMYKQVVLLDYSLEQLQYARQQLGDDGYLYVAADAYHMPFQTGVFDGATMIRVIHHMENVPAVLGQIQQILAHRAKFILEFANKRNLKAMLRHTMGRNGWSPHTQEPVEFVELNFNFHPEYMQEQVKQVGFEIHQAVPVSWFRVGLLKRSVPTSILSGLDSIVQKSGWKISPSVFLDLELTGQTDSQLDIGQDNPLNIFKCPRSNTSVHHEDDMVVSETGVKWGVYEGVYDFRNPLD
jgi:ubiquinone/menaquinone biosynthesis C-methylase UbiE